MTIDEIIKFSEEVAEELEEEAVKGCCDDTEIMNDCYEWAKEHRQLAEWLRELKQWREFGRKNAQFINNCLLKNHIDELFSSEIKDDADILRIANETLTLITTNESCKSFNERYERGE